MTTLNAVPQSSQSPEIQEHVVSEWAKARMSEHRFLHTSGVVKAVTELASHYGISDVAPLRLAGWIHDAAKEWTDADLLDAARQQGYPVRPVEEASPSLLHGAVALALAHQALNITHPVITSAVLYHTTGHPNMTLADKLFYLADLIEPTRSYAWIMQARVLAYKDIDEALLFAVTYQMRRLLKQGYILDPRSLELHNHLIQAGVRLVPRSRG